MRKYDTPRRRGVTNRLSVVLAAFVAPLLGFVAFVAPASATSVPATEAVAASTQAQLLGQPQQAIPEVVQATSPQLSLGQPAPQASYGRYLYYASTNQPSVVVYIYVVYDNGLTYVKQATLRVGQGWDGPGTRMAVSDGRCAMKLVMNNGSVRSGSSIDISGGVSGRFSVRCPSRL